MKKMVLPGGWRSVLFSGRYGRRLSPLEGVVEDREAGWSEGKAFPS